MSISRWKIENLLVVAAVGQKSDWNISANSEATEAVANVQMLMWNSKKCEFPS